MSTPNSPKQKSAEPIQKKTDWKFWIKAILWTIFADFTVMTLLLVLSILFPRR